MIRVPDNIHVAIATIGGVCCDDLIGAMRQERWSVIVIKSMKELLTLAESKEYHMAIVATDKPEDIERAAVRNLLSMQDDVSAMFLVPDANRIRICPALWGVTFDQVHNLNLPAAELVEIFSAESLSIVQTQPEYEIICVDDDKNFLVSLESFLPGYLEKLLPRFALHFQFFTSPTEALLQTREIPPGHLALVISDQVMPEMKGIEFLCRVKEMSQDTKRVLLTGYAGLDSAIDAINEHILDKYFTKPIEQPDEFTSAARHLMNAYHLHKTTTNQRDRLMSQFEFIRIISTVRNTEKALKVVTEFLQEQIGAKQVTIMLLEDKKLVVHASAGQSGNFAPGDCVSVHDGICARVLEHHRPILATRAQDIPSDVSEDPLIACPLVAAPLTWGDNTLGVIVITESRENRPFTRNEQMLISFVVDVASVTVGGLKDREALEGHYLDTMASMMEIVEAKDRYTRGHTDRVRALAVVLAKKVGITGKNLLEIEHAAALHDIGKIAVPDKIIFKPGPLNNEEYDIIKKHPEHGDKILKHLSFLNRVRLITISHHERYDGGGYPNGLMGEEIPLAARMLAIVDSYDAMTSARPYRDPMPSEQALKEIEVNAGRQFDPRLALIFVKMMRDVSCNVPATQAEGKSAVQNREEMP